MRYAPTLEAAHRAWSLEAALPGGSSFGPFGVEIRVEHSRRSPTFDELPGIEDWQIALVMTDRERAALVGRAEVSRVTVDACDHFVRDMDWVSDLYGAWATGIQHWQFSPQHSRPTGCPAVC